MDATPKIGTISPSARVRVARLRGGNSGTEVILTGINRQGAFGEAYVHLVVQGAGFVLARYSQDSGHKIDWTVSGAGADNTTKDPRLDIQVKSTDRERLESGECSYSIDRSLFDWARKPRNLLDVPRVIVLVRVPENVDHWMAQTDDELVTKHCAYWVCLRDQPELPVDQGQKAVHFPAANKFDVNGLTELMSNIREDNWP
jgi:hypothetical protein